MTRPSTEEIRLALARVITNSINHPNPSDVLGRDLSLLIEKTTEAVEELLESKENS